MSTIIERLRQLAKVPEDDEAFNAWLKSQDALEFLRANAKDDDFVLYATPQFTFVHAILVPASRIEPPDVEDLLSWSFNGYTSWGVDYDSSDPPVFSLSEPLHGTRGKTFRGAQQLVFLRSFEGLIGDKSYWEVLQPFVHVFGLHFLQERQAWCRLDKRGDIEDVIRIIRFPAKGNDFGGAAIVCNRAILDEWMLLNDLVMIRTFDFTRYRPSSFGGWSDAVNRPQVTVDGDLIYRSVIETGKAGYVRGCQIVRPIAGREALVKRFGWPDEDGKEYASFIAYDWKNRIVREISCAPGETANYFTKSELPFETSPAFFRPDVLLKYKADSDKYRLEDRSIHCRGTWSLQTYDINEAGQVHTYIVYLRDLPYEEQLYWKSYNEPPKASISRRAVTTDFEGRWDQEYEPLSSLRAAADVLHKQDVPWWKLRSRKLPERVHYPATNSADEWADEILHLQQLVVEGFEEKWLRQKATALGRKPDAQQRSLKMVEECLMGVGFEPDHAREITAPFHRLHELRIKVKGHAVGEEANELKRAALAEHRTYRKHFEALCSECDESLRTITEVFKDFR
jgi:hypothetical protein